MVDNKVPPLEISMGRVCIFKRNITGRAEGTGTTST